MSILDERLTKEWAEDFIRSDKRLITAIIYDLQQYAKAIASDIQVKDYDTMEQFIEDHRKGKSPFDLLEGLSDRIDDVMVLKQCPMTGLLKALSTDGKLPDFYQQIVDKFVSMHKNKGAILHPFCIVHQVIRAAIGEHVKIGGKPVRVYQIACRSMSSGKVVFANEGTTKVALSEDDILKKIDGKACMYLLKV